MTSVLWNKLTPREQLNQVTGYLDASQVYGYDDDTANELRDLSSDLGLLREGLTSNKHKALLPFANEQFIDCRRNLSASSTNCFLAGDFRANEQIGLTVMHTIWMREHNRIARELKLINPHWIGDKIYHEARKIVGAEMQVITYRDWIPIILGGSSDKIFDSYQGYDSNLDASISNVFATAALRFGHSMIQPKLERLTQNLQSIPQGPLNLRDAFFAPWRIIEEGGIDPLLRGMYITPAKSKKPEQNLNSELTEKLFETAHAVALDLGAMNIQRGRDHALPSYVHWRKHCNMSVINNFDELRNDISSDKVRARLQELYGHYENIDVWVGGLLEDVLPLAKVGPLFKCLLAEQFERMRNGDRFWYENPNVFQHQQLDEIKKTSLARVLCDNADNITSIQNNVFLIPDKKNNFVPCTNIPFIELQVWSECCEECNNKLSEKSRPLRAKRHSEKSIVSTKKTRFNDVESQRNKTIENIEAILHNISNEYVKANEILKYLGVRIEDMKKLLEQLKTQ